MGLNMTQKYFVPKLKSEEKKNTRSRSSGCEWLRAAASGCPAASGHAHAPDRPLYTVASGRTPSSERAYKHSLFGIVISSVLLEVGMPKMPCMEHHLFLHARSPKLRGTLVAKGFS